MPTDFYQRITDQIVAQLEEGVRPWLKPWNTDHMAGRVSLPRRHNGVKYRGVNIVALWIAAAERGYAAPIWMTFKQALNLGGCVRKGEKGSAIVYADRVTRLEHDEATGADSAHEVHFVRGYTVFNVEQIDGLPEPYYATPAPNASVLPRIERAERFFSATGAVICHNSSRACYAPGPDHIRMPPFEAFRDAVSYYAALAHEGTHWTRHPSRLDRSFGQKRYGDHGYAMEELVAELGAAFLCGDLELTPELRDDHASYLEAWLKVLKGDKRAIFTAAAHAQRAADFLNGLQPKEA